MKVPSNIQNKMHMAAKYFAKGVYVPNTEPNGHPCGWDFVDFKYIEDEDDVENYRFEYSDISNGYG